MNDLLTVKQVTSFEPLLAAYAAAGHRLRVAVDGGAGAGGTAKAMLRHVAGPVFAFEPFVGNHRFFTGLDRRIQLRKEALAESGGRMAFHVPSVVTEHSEWGRRGMAGYSSGGHLVSTGAFQDALVECVRGDEVVDAADFIKLDLQGGELNALRGFARLLPTTALLWIEYSGQPGLLEYLDNNGFLVFDTPYLLRGDRTESSLREFSPVRSLTLSNGEIAWYGFRRRPWHSYNETMARYKDEFQLVQTDLACVNHRRVDEFLASLSWLAKPAVSEAEMLAIE